MQTVNEIKIFFANEKHTDLLATSSVLNQQNKHAIDCLNWPAFPYKPSVFFSMAYTNDALLLKYFVQEKFAIATVTNTNGDVYKDSCVEVFLSFDKKHYYNLEFNCKGVARVEYGRERKDRTFLPVDVVQQIKTVVSSTRQGAETAWELTVVIPFTVFIYDAIDSLSGKTIRGNFYKCGDELPLPHFLSWSPIQSHEPDFHLPQFFGKIMFH